MYYLSPNSNIAALAYTDVWVFSVGSFVVVTFAH